MSGLKKRLRPLLRNRSAMAGLVLVALLALAGLFAPLIAPHPPDLRFSIPKPRSIAQRVTGFKRIPSGVACTMAFVPSSMLNCFRSQLGITT